MLVTAAAEVTSRSLSWMRARPAVLVHAAFAAVCWIPLLLTAPGRVAADTRPQLYLDPGQFIERARSIWDPFVHMGTVTHQNLGLIAPMGWWYWLVDATGTPMWIGQRLWIGAIVFAAAAGMLHLGRTFGWRLTGATASAAIYAFSPYLLQYATRTSVLLLPFAGLPWLLSFTVRALRHGRWRDAGGFAVVVFLVGSVNATSLILVGLGPALWVVCSAVTRQVTLRRALATTARLGVLGLGVSVWWIVGLAVQSRHGLPVLTYTETLDQVAVTSSATEALRGLGYWVFYGREVLDPNIGASVAYTQNPILLAITYAIPLAALAAAVTVRFAERGYFVLLVVVGTIVATGAYPIGDPSPGGSLFLGAAETTAGLALRSSTRAVPLVVLGVAVLIGRAVDALPIGNRGRWWSVAGVGAAALAALPALVTGGFVDSEFDRPSELPDHWSEVAERLHAQPSDGAVLELPGIQFATYRWGTTYEPVTPGILDRPVIAREQLPYGSPPSADLLIALDRRLQEGVTEPSALAPIARLMGAEWILLRNDLAFERYVSPRPRRLWNDLTPLPPGLAHEASFGEAVRNTPDPRLPLLDEEFLGLSADTEDPAPVELLSVDDPTARLRVAPTGPSLVVDGDAEGVVDIAAAGLLDSDGPLFYAASLLDGEPTLDQVLEDGAAVIHTDTNRKRERRWRSVRWSTGYTERADQQPPSTEFGDGDLDVFPDIEPSAQTTVEQLGATVDATAYGGPFTLDPDVRPALALDGREDTAWVVGPFADARGESITVAPDEPAESLALTQTDGPNRITVIEVSVNGGPGRLIRLDERSAASGGQPVDVGDEPIESLRIEIVETLVDSGGGAPVGFAEIDLDGLVVEEIVRLPTAFVDRLADRSATLPVSYVLTRLRSDPTEPVRGDEERTLRRRLRVAADRSFDLGGSARLSDDADDAVIDSVLGIDGPAVETSTVLPGDLGSRGRSAVDGDASTAWQPAFLDLEGAWLQVGSATPITMDHLDMTLVDDGDHSVPTRVTVTVDGASQTIDVPLDAGQRSDDGRTRSVNIPMESVTGSSIRFTVEAAEPRLTTDYYTRAPIATPVGIAEIRLPGVEPTAVPTMIDTGCRDDLVDMDGTPVPVRVDGSVADALAGRPLDIVGCSEVAMPSGDHDIRAADGEATGLDLDRLTLRSPGTEPSRPAIDQSVPPLVDVDHVSSTRYEGALEAGTDAYVVLAESHEDGWSLMLDGEDQGTPLLADAGFNAWRVPASDDARNVVVEWKPQRAVERGILVSALAVVIASCCLVFGGRGRSQAAVPVHDPSFAHPRSSESPWASSLLFAIVAGILGYLTLGWVGLLLGAGAVVLTCVARWGTSAVAVATVAAWAAAATWIVAEQILRPRRPDFEWATGLATPNRLALAAIVLVVVVVLVDDPSVEERV